MKILRTLLRYGAYGLVGVLALALGAVAVFTLTERGRSNLASLVSTAVSGEGTRIAIADVEGIWTGRLRARDVVIADAEGPWLVLRGVAVDWSPLALLGFAFQAERVHADRIEVARLPVSSGQSSGGGSFSLPVQVDIAEIDLPDILLGGELAGRVASLAASGSLRISGSPVAAQARLEVERTDGTQGSLSVDAAYLPGENRIDLDIDGAEPAGGIVVALLGLPGEPAVAISAGGSGPASNWSGRAEFSVDGTVVTRLSGRHQFTDAGSRVELTGQGAFASFLPASLAPLAAGDTQIAFAGTIGGGRVAVENARLASAALEASASGTLEPAGRSDFTLSARPTGSAPRLAFGRGAGAVTVELGELELSLSGQAGALALDGRAAVPYVALPDHEAEAIELTVASRDLDLAAMSGTVDAQVRVAAAGSANEIVAALLAGGIWGDVRVVLAGDDIRFATDTLRTGTATVAASGTYSRADGALAADVSAEARAVALPAAARPLLGDTVTVAARVARAATGDLAVTALEARSGTLAAAGEARLAGNAVDARISGTLADMSLLSAQAQGSASFSLAATGELARPQIVAEAGSARMIVAGRAIENLALNARLNADPAAPSGALSLTGSVGGQPLTGGGTLVASPGGGGEMRDLSLKLGANSLDGALTLDTAFRPAGAVNFSLPELASLAALALVEARGSARGSLRLDVSQGRPSLTLDALVDHLAAGSVQAGEVRLSATVDDYLAAPAAAGAASAGRIVAGGTELRDVTLALSQEAGWTRFDGRLSADGIPVAAKGRALYANGRAAVELETAEVSPRGIAMRLAAPTALVWANGALRLDGFTVAAAGGRASASGTAGQSLDLAIRLDSLPAAAINAFAPGLDASGTLTGTARVTGAASAPAVAFDAQLAGGAIAQTRAAGFGAMDVTANGTYSGSGVRFQARVGDGSGLGMDGGGTVNLAARTASLDFSGRVPFGFLTRTLAAQGVALDGGADVSIAVRGSLFSPDISGSVRTIGARFLHAASGIAVNDLVAEIALGGGAARINALSGQLSSGGALSGSGSVGIDPAQGFPADLTLRVSDGRYADGRTVTASFGGEIRLSGPLTANPLLSGTVALGRTVITVPDRLPGSLATLDVQHRNAPASVARQEEALRPAGGGGGSGGLTLDLGISAPQQIFVVGRGIDVELGGNLRLTGALASPQAVGGFTMRRGRLSLLGRRLDFTTGTVTFSGSMVPWLNLIASTRAESATVTVSVTGPATDPAFAFTSSPSLPEDEVMARLVFGKAMSGLSPVQIAQLAAAVGQLAGIGGSTSFLERLRERIGVDDIDVRTDDETGDTSVAVGKYLNDRTYLTLEKGSQPGSGRATIDLDIGGGVKLRGEATDAGQTRGGIFYEREY